ncbi:TPA: hypothetical protein ACGPSD_001288 [Streptococcus agalactiae]
MTKSKHFSKTFGVDLGQNLVNTLYKGVKMIIKELDNIGINRKNLFRDHDNIAKYLIEKV